MKIPFFNKFRVLFYLFFLLPLASHAQIDITKYASKELFEAKPILEWEQTIEEEEEESTSVFQQEIQEGMEFWNSGKLDEAALFFQNMVDQYPEIEILHYYLGAIYMNNNEQDMAVESFKEVLNINPLMLEAKYLIGLVELERGEIKMAKEIMETLADVPLYAAYGYYGIALVAMEQENYYRALRMFEKCIKTDPTFKEAYIPLTYLDIIGFDGLRRSVKRMDYAVAMDSTWQEARMIRAMLYVLQENDIEQFNKDIDELIRQDGSNYHYISIRAFLDIELKNYRNAVDNFQKTLNMEVDTTNRGAHKFNTRLELNKSMQVALNYYQEVFLTIDHKAGIYLDKGICAFFKKDEKEALQYYDSASMTYEGPAVAFLNGVIFQSQRNNKQKAIDAYTTVINADSTIYAAYSSRAKLYIDMNQLNKAYLDCSRMIKLNRHHKSGFKMRGTLLLGANQFMKAYRDFTAGLLIDSSDTDLWFNRAIAAYRAKFFSESIHDTGQLLNLKPNDKDAYYLQAVNYLAMNDSTSAIAPLDSASRLSSFFNDDIHKLLLAVSINLKLPENEKNALDRLVKSNRFDEKLLINRIYFCLREKDIEQAKKDIKKAIKIDKKNGEIYFLFAKILSEEGKDKEAKKALEKSRKLGFSEN